MLKLAIWPAVTVWLVGCVAIEGWPLFAGVAWTSPEHPRFRIANKRVNNKSARRCALASLRAVPADTDGACAEVAGARPSLMLVIGPTKIPQNKLHLLLVFNLISPNHFSLASRGRRLDSAGGLGGLTTIQKDRTPGSRDY